MPPSLFPLTPLHISPPDALPVLPVSSLPPTTTTILHGSRVSELTLRLMRRGGCYHRLPFARARNPSTQITVKCSDCIAPTVEHRDGLLPPLLLSYHPQPPRRPDRLTSCPGGGTPGMTCSCTGACGASRSKCRCRHQRWRRATCRLPPCKCRRCSPPPPPSLHRP